MRSGCRQGTIGVSKLALFCQLLALGFKIHILKLYIKFEIF